MKCKHCGGESFTGYQELIVCVDVLVNGDGERIKDLDTDIARAHRISGPYQCTGCGAEYDALANDEEISGPVDGWEWKDRTAHSRNQLLDVLAGYAKQIQRNKDTPTVLIDDLEKSVNYVLQQNGRS